MNPEEIQAKGDINHGATSFQSIVNSLGQDEAGDFSLERIRKSFLRFMAKLLGKYRNYVSFGRDDAFDSGRFVREARAAARPLLSRVVETQMLAQFIADCTQESVPSYIRLFDECIIERYNRSIRQNKGTKLPTPFLSDTRYAHTSTVDAIFPHNGFLPKESSGIFQYTRFPVLSTDLFWPVRWVDALRCTVTTVESDDNPSTSTEQRPSKPSMTRRMSRALRNIRSEVDGNVDSTNADTSARKSGNVTDEASSWLKRLTRRVAKQSESVGNDVERTQDQKDEAMGSVGEDELREKLSELLQRGPSYRQYKKDRSDTTSSPNKEPLKWEPSLTVSQISFNLDSYSETQGYPQTNSPPSIVIALDDEDFLSNVSAGGRHRSRMLAPPSRDPQILAILPTSTPSSPSVPVNPLIATQLTPLTITPPFTSPSASPSPPARVLTPLPLSSSTDLRSMSNDRHVPETAQHLFATQIISSNFSSPLTSPNPTSRSLTPPPLPHVLKDTLVPDVPKSPPRQLPLPPKPHLSHSCIEKSRR